MTKRSIKRILTVVLATSMVLGCTITAFADPVSSDGTGTYEGGEMQYPALSVTLPTIPAGTYDYIADPNGLIALTSAAAHTGSTFTGDTGVFFLTSANTYTNKSAALEVTNENAQDIDVSVKLEQKTAGAEGIAYSDTADFDSEDKDKKLYLAVTDDAAQDPQIAALSASQAATVTATVEGKSANFEPSWSQGKGYGYVKKTGDLTWNDCSFCLTGALNTNATWEDDLTFPTITVTWSYAEHEDEPADAAPSIATTSYAMSAGQPVNITVNLGAGELAATGVSSVMWNGSNLLTTNNSASYSNGVITIASGPIDYLLGNASAPRTMKVVFDDSAATEVTVTLTE